MVTFVYGTDFQRQMGIWFVSGSVRTISILIGLFVFSAATLLCIIRRKMKLRRDGLISTFIETVVAFIGGGNLQMRHKLEKLFFAILLFGAFFLTSMFAGDLLDSVILSLNQKITTFKQLAEINSPIYVQSESKAYLDHIHITLKWVHIDHSLLISLFICFFSYFKKCNRAEHHIQWRWVNKEIELTK